MKLYLRKPIKEKTCLNFLKEYFAQRCPKTFTEKNCSNTSAKCVRNRSRSFSDLSFLCKTYFPSLSYNKIIYYITYFIVNKKTIEIKTKKGDLVQIGSYYCHDVKKYVIHHNVNVLERYDQISEYFSLERKSEPPYNWTDGINCNFLYTNYLKHKR